MAAKEPKLVERDVQGVNQLEKLHPLVERLQGVGCYQGKADNRALHMDQYVMLVLLCFFDPILTSLRGARLADVSRRRQSLR